MGIADYAHIKASLKASCVSVEQIETGDRELVKISFFTRKCKKHRGSYHDWNPNQSVEYEKPSRSERKEINKKYFNPVTPSTLYCAPNAPGLNQVKVGDKFKAEIIGVNNQGEEEAETKILQYEWYALGFE